MFMFSSLKELASNIKRQLNMILKINYTIQELTYFLHFSYRAFYKYTLEITNIPYWSPNPVAYFCTSYFSEIYLQLEVHNTNSFSYDFTFNTKLTLVKK